MLQLDDMLVDGDEELVLESCGLGPLSRRRSKQESLGYIDNCLVSDQITLDQINCEPYPMLS